MSCCRRSRQPSRCVFPTRPGCSTTAAAGDRAAGARARRAIPHPPTNIMPRPATSTTPSGSSTPTSSPSSTPTTSRRRTSSATRSATSRTPVALVQTPQDFYNLSSFEHDSPPHNIEALDAPTSALFHEQTLFYRILAGKEPLGRRVLVRHEFGRPRRGPARYRRGRDRHHHRGHPHDRPAAPPGLADRLSQRGSRAWAGGEQRRPTSSSAIAGAPARCRSCGARIRSSFPASRSVSG